MKKIIKTSILMMAFGLSLFLLAPNAFAGDDPADCPPVFMEHGIYNMKNKWFGGCKTKCGHFCEVDGDAGIDINLPGIHL